MNNFILVLTVFASISAFSYEPFEECKMDLFSSLTAHDYRPSEKELRSVCESASRLDFATVRAIRKMQTRRDSTFFIDTFYKVQKMTGDQKREQIAILMLRSLR